ncbi:hypothetical protein C6N75_12680 [Streptomyces solincola]|uniref:Tape measure protein n=1 Tax=Streptomyces solincola TaxID=2100817 RepID=A0A2S9PWR8_9ACTN|nr:hypothetical protein [Streptomyces solincola]PRH78855.1 hypothetical protein C6N75_12680 [Streptomyces solincola]
MAEGLQAGRLEVTVVSVLDGFAAELRTKVEAAAEGLAAKVKVEIDDKGLRKRLKKAVEKASKGVTATVNVRVDRDGLRGELDEVARRVADSDVRVPVRPDDEGDTGGGLLGRIRRLLRGAQDEADAQPVNVPFQFSMGGGRGGRGKLRMLAMGALVSVAQPAIAAITQYGAALTALVSAAAPAVGVLGAIPGLILAGGTAAIATKVAFSGFGEALKQTLKAQQQLAAGTKLTEAQQTALDESLKGLSTSARATVKTVASLSGEWRSMKQSVQERFFSKISDEIKPLSSAVLPLLKGALGDAAGQMGNLAKRGADAMQSGPFAKDFKTVAASNSKVIGNVTDGVANLAAAAGHFLVASGPFVERVAEAGERFTLWVRASAQAGRETGSLGKFLDHAADKAKQLGRTTLELGKGIAGVARAGMDSGNALLDGLEGAMQRFNRWANSGEGQKSMKKFFSDAAPTFHELNALVGDLVRGLGRMATDSGVTDLVRQIRTELMPAVGAFLDSIGGSVGPAVIGLISNIASAIASLSSAGLGLGALLQALNGLLNIFNGIMNVIPGASFALGAFLGGLLMLRVATSISRGVQGLVGSIRQVGTVSTTSAAGVATQTTMWQRMGSTYRTAAADGRRLSGSMGAIRVAGGGLKTALGGMVTALGGPWAAAITAGTILIGLWANSQEKAARATEAHKERISSLATALRDSNGAIDANVRAQAAQLLQDADLADGKGKLVDAMRDAGINLRQLTDAYLDDGDGLEKLEKQLRDAADATLHWEDVAGGKASKQVMTDKGKEYKAAADALSGMSGELEKGKQKYKEFADATNTSGNKGTDSFTRLKTAVEGMSSATATADSRVDGLKRALDELTGGTQSFHDAQTRVNAAVLSVNDAIANNTKELKDANKELINQDGSLRTVTRAGQDYNQHITELRDSSLDAANAAFEMAKQHQISLPEAMKMAEGEVQKARDAAIKYGTDLGLTKDQAAGLANQMGLIPSSVSVLLQANGMEKVTADILSLSTKLLALPPNKTITVKTPTAAAITALQNLGFEVTKLPGGKQVSISAPTGTARASLGALVSDLAATPGSKKVTVQTLVKQAVTDLTGVRDKVAGLPAGKKLKMEAPTKLAQEELKDLGYEVKVLKGKKIEITAPNATPLAQVQRIQEKINGLTGKTVHVTVQYSESGKPSVVGRPQANGGILRYAEGGIRAAGSRIRAFANGTERHVAQIAKAGEWRIWAEDETGGEAYLPLAKAKRKRSKMILDEVARMFGGMVVYPGQGALSAFANGAVSMHRASTSTTAPRSAVPTGNTSLVGGDLNLTMTGAPMSPSEALGDALFELRRIRRGGAYAAG